MEQSFDIGAALLANGWTQGSMISASGFVVGYHRREGDRWVTFTEHAGDVLVCANQLCDVVSNQEEHLELLPARWIADERIVTAARKGNSSRWLATGSSRPSRDGGKEFLIIDGRVRVFVEKTSLVALKPDGVLPAPNRGKLRDFLARRYDREAVANEIVDALHKPISEAIHKLKKTDAKWEVLDAIGEIRYSVKTGEAPLRVRMYFIREVDAAAPDDVAMATVAGWLRGILDTKGAALLEDWRVLTRGEISVDAYEKTTAIGLDHYSDAGR